MAKQFMDLTVTGADDLDKVLSELAPRSAVNILRNTVTKVAAQVRDDAKKRVPVDTGNLKKAIKSRRRRGTRDTVLADVYVDKGNSAKHDGYYWHFVEFGTQGYSVGERRRDSKGQSHGKVSRNIPARPAQPFIGPAIEHMQGKVNEVYREEFWRAYERELTRLAKKAAKGR